MNTQSPIHSACAAVGSQSALARCLGVSPAMVNQMIKGARPVPVKYCAAIERVTAGAVTRQDLRPDDYWLIWPDLPAPAKEAA